MKSNGRCLTKAGDVSTWCFRTVDRDYSFLVNPRWQCVKAEIKENRQSRQGISSTKKTRYSGQSLGQTRFRRLNEPAAALLLPNSAPSAGVLHRNSQNTTRQDWLESRETLPPSEIMPGGHPSPPGRLLGIQSRLELEQDTLQQRQVIYRSGMRGCRCDMSGNEKSRPLI